MQASGRGRRLPRSAACVAHPAQRRASPPPPPIGGCWTPIGDVTTTMLWLGGMLSAVPTMRDLLLPGLVALLVPVALLQACAPEFRAGAADAPGGSGRAAGAQDGPAALAGGSPQAGASGAIASGGVMPSAAATSSSGNRSSSTTSSDSSSSSGGIAASSSGSGGGGSSGALQPPDPDAYEAASTRGPLVLAVGTAALVSVPLFTHTTQLPPFMGVLTGLSALWLLTDALHFGESRGPRVSDVLRKLDIEAVMFFLGTLPARAPRRPCPAACCVHARRGAHGRRAPHGPARRPPPPMRPRAPGILLAVGALEAAGILQQLALALGGVMPNTGVLAVTIGMASALVDNVPLVAATMAMYDLPRDSQLWQLIALCAGAARRHGLHMRLPACMAWRLHGVAWGILSACSAHPACSLERRQHTCNGACTQPACAQAPAARCS